MKIDTDQLQQALDMTTSANVDPAAVGTAAAAIAVTPALPDYGVVFVFALLGALVAVSRIDGALLTNRKGISILGAGTGLGLSFSWIGSIYLARKFNEWGFDTLNATQCVLPVANCLGYFGHKLLGLADRKADSAIGKVP